MLQLTAQVFNLESAYAILLLFLLHLLSDPSEFLLSIAHLPVHLPLLDLLLGLLLLEHAGQLALLNLQLLHLLLLVRLVAIMVESSGRLLLSLSDLLYVLSILVLVAGCGGFLVLSGHLVSFFL